MIIAGAYDRRVRQRQHNRGYWPGSLRLHRLSLYCHRRLRSGLVLRLGRGRQREFDRRLGLAFPVIAPTDHRAIRPDATVVVPVGADRCKGKGTGRRTGYRTMAPAGQRAIDLDAAVVVVSGSDRYKVAGRRRGLDSAVIAPADYSVSGQDATGVCFCPALTDAKEPSGGVAWPSSLSPQQATAPSGWMPQAWSGPVSTDTKEPAGGSDHPSRPPPRRSGHRRRGAGRR